MQLEIGDLDELATREDVEEAIIHQFADYQVGEDWVRSLEDTWWHTNCDISMPVELAQSAMELGRIRVGRAN